MKHASIPLDYWDYILESVVFIINRLPSAALFFFTPFHKAFDQTPDYKFFKVLGCLCFPFFSSFIDEEEAEAIRRDYPQLIL